MSEVVQNKVTENSVTTTVVKPEGSLATITAEKIYADNPVATIIELLNSIDTNWAGTAKQLAQKLLEHKGIKVDNATMSRIAKSLGQQLKNNLIQFNEMLNNRILTAVSKANGPKSYKLRLAPKAKLSDAHKEILSQSTEQVNHPSHYNQGGVECIDALKSCLGLEGFRGFCAGNAIKYLWRAGHKGDAKTDIKKASWYVDELLMSFDGESNG